MSKSQLDVLHRSRRSSGGSPAEGNRPEIDRRALTDGQRAHVFTGTEQGVRAVLDCPTDALKKPTATQRNAKKPSDATRPPSNGGMSGRNRRRSGIITADKWNTYEQAAAAVWRNPYARAARGRRLGRVHPAFGDEPTGIECKARPIGCWDCPVVGRRRRATPARSSSAVRTRSATTSKAASTPRWCEERPLHPAGVHVPVRGAGAAVSLRSTRPTQSSWPPAWKRPRSTRCSLPAAHPAGGPVMGT